MRVKRYFIKIIFKSIISNLVYSDELDGYKIYQIVALVEFFFNLMINSFKVTRKRLTNKIILVKSSLIFLDRYLNQAYLQ